MNQFLKDYFYYTKNEIRGVMTLLTLLLILSITPLFINSTTIKNKTDFSDFEAKAALIAAVASEPESNYTNSFDEEEVRPSNIETFYFNPNTASQNDFERLGLSPKTAQSIINYRNKGGKFYKAEDFKKIYTLAENDYQRLLPFIQVEKSNRNFTKNETEAATTKIAENFTFDPNTASQNDFERLGLSTKTAQSIINYRSKGGKFYKAEDFKKVYTLNEADYERLKSYIDIPKKEKTTTNIASTEKEETNGVMGFAAAPETNYVKKSTDVKIDINTAKVEDFQQLKGIGAGYAKRIIEYRENLGGFVNINQIQEVYGLSKEIFDNIEPQLIHTSKTIQKININTANYETLSAHPYLDNKRANAIIQYRKQHGDFKSIDDLKKIYAISAKIFEQIKPYLTVN